MNRSYRVMAGVLCLCLGMAQFVVADNMKEARARRKARHAQVSQIVNSGAALEGDDGFLVPQPSLDAGKANLVKAENNDRRIGYEAIAKANGKTLAEIGKKAAEINRARARAAK